MPKRPEFYLSETNMDFWITKSDAEIRATRAFNRGFMVGMAIAFASFLCLSVTF